MLVAHVFHPLHGILTSKHSARLLSSVYGFDSREHLLSWMYSITTICEVPALVFFQQCSAVPLVVHIMLVV